MARKTIKDTGSQAASIPVERGRRFHIGIEVAGTAPLIMNKFSQKALEQMLKKHMGHSTEREAKKPNEMVAAAIQRNVKGEVALPTTAFKKAMITAADQIKSLKKTQLRVQVFVLGNSVPITYGAMVPRMDVVRLAGMQRTPDVRFRPEFSEWRARFVVQYSELMSVQTVTDLVDRAGSVGVGEWRPEKNGSFGTFEVVRTFDGKEAEDVRKLCSPILEPLKIPDWAMNAELTPELLARLASPEDGDEEADELGEVGT